MRQHPHLSDPRVLPVGYLMHNAAHELPVGHAGQLQVNWNTRGDVRNGGHDLQRQEESTAIRNRRKSGKREGTGPERQCILMKAPGHVGGHRHCGQGRPFPSGKTRLCREALGLRTQSAQGTAPARSRSQPLPGDLNRAVSFNCCVNLQHS